MFLHAPNAVEKGMPLFVGFFQVMIASGAFFGGQIVDHLGIQSVLWTATVLCFIGATIVLLLGKGIGKMTSDIPIGVAH